MFLIGRGLSYTDSKFSAPLPCPYCRVKDGASLPHLKVAESSARAKQQLQKSGLKPKGTNQYFSACFLLTTAPFHEQAWGAQTKTRKQWGRVSQKWIAIYHCNQEATPHRGNHPSQGGMLSQFMVYTEQADTADWCQICHDVYCKARRFNGVTLRQPRSEPLQSEAWWMGSFTCKIANGVDRTGMWGEDKRHIARFTLVLALEY